jgi:hypothetical protein
MFNSPLLFRQPRLLAGSGTEKQKGELEKTENC